MDRGGFLRCGHVPAWPHHPGALASIKPLILGLFLGIDLVFAGVGWIGVGIGLKGLAYEAHQKAGHEAGHAEGYEAGRKAGRDEAMTTPEPPPSSEA